MDAEAGIPKPKPTGSVKEYLKKIFYNPVSIISLIFAICVWRLNVRERNLTYYVSPTRTPIVQKGNLDNFSITFMGTQITNDLSAAEIQIWNQGKLAIRKSDILKPVTLRTENGEPIYKSITQQSRDGIGFNIINSTNPKQSVLTFDWNILEHNDGIKIQIIHAGNVNLPITVDGGAS